VDLLGQQGNWRQVCYGNLRGWVGAKHVGYLPSPGPGHPGVRPEGAGHPVSSLGSRSSEQPSGSPPAPSTGFLVVLWNRLIHCFPKTREYNLIMFNMFNDCSSN